MLGLLVQTFNNIQLQENPILYLSLLTSLKENISDDKSKFNIEYIQYLLQYVADSLPDFYELNTFKNMKEKLVLELTLQLLNCILSLPSIQLLHPKILSIDSLTEIGNHQKISNFARNFLEWLSISQAYNSNIVSTNVGLVIPNVNYLKEILALKEEILKLIKILSSCDYGAKYFLKLCLSVI